MAADTYDYSHQSLCILGSTGSVGENALRVAKDLGVKVHSLSAYRNVDRLVQQAREHHAQMVAIGDESLVGICQTALSDTDCQVLGGSAGLCALAADSANSVVISAIVGAAGLLPTVAAVDAGKRVGIANKEPLVMAGAHIVARAACSGATLLPIDSEHCAIFQCLAGHPTEEVRELLITGSGGPLRTVENLKTVSVEQALAHPTWSMGPKITIDSATLMNKALEIIEARWLFAIEPERIRVIIHPQSIVHSMVAFCDGSLIAQLGQPDMRIPIQHAITWPHYAANDIPTPDLCALGSLDFSAPRRQDFPSLDFAYEALRLGGFAPTVLNAANECAVDTFLAERCSFTDIFRTIEYAMRNIPAGAADDIAAICAVDQATRQRLAQDISP